MTNSVSRASWIKRCLHDLGIAVAWLLLVCLTLWAGSALYFDFSFARRPFLTPVMYVTAVAGLACVAKGRLARMAVVLAAFLIVLACWLSLKPSNDRPWKPDNAQMPWAEIDGDRVTIHNFRHCYYRREDDFTCEWFTKTVFLSQLRGIDLFVDYWGSPWIAHPIVSFQFGSNTADADYVAASIEARYQAGQSYSALRAFFRQFTIIYVLANERDLIRLRTNYRSGENVYLFHMNASPEWSRLLFLQYLQQANQLREHPRWFNAVTNNCTTNIFRQMAATGHLPTGSSQYAWWVILNGKAPEKLYNGGNFAGDLPYPELKQRAYINPVAITLKDAPDFSRAIRLHRPGFDKTVHRGGFLPRPD